jgi:signal transduction histidine kinase
MKLTIGRKLFVYTSSILVVVLLMTFLVLERHQAKQWDEYLLSQSQSFARFATPEVLKLFRGRFQSGDSQAVRQVTEFLAFNQDLVQFSLHAPEGRILFQSGRYPAFHTLEIPQKVLELSAASLESDELSATTRKLQENHRILDLLIPAFGPTGAKILSARYLLSYDRVDRRLVEVRARFAVIAVIALSVSLLLAAIVARRFTRPLEELTEGVRAIGGGDLQTQIPVVRNDEVGVLANAFNDMAASLGASRSELTETNQRLRQANSELRDMQAQLLRSERLAAIGQLAAGVSHEIDNPVGIILGYAELLYDELDADDSRREDVQAIIDECRRCRRITGSLLGLSRTAPEEVLPVDMVKLIEGVFATLRPQKLFRYIQMTLHKEDSLPVVSGDADRLRQVLVNLFLNGAQAMQGEGTLDVFLKQQQEILVILVRDNGPGIPAGMEESIFQPFVTTKGSDEGTGLGLPLCRKLIEDHGGHLELERVSAGACFRLALPRFPREKSFDKASGDSLG